MRIDIDVLGKRLGDHILTKDIGLAAFKCGFGTLLILILKNVPIFLRNVLVNIKS